MQEQENRPSAAVRAFASRPGKAVLRPAGLLVLVLLVFAAAGCGKASPGGGAGAQGVTEPDPLQVRIEFSKAVALYDPVEVKVTLKGSEKFLPVKGDVTAAIELPPSAAYINGQLRWEGQIAPGESKQFTATIAFVAEGHSSVRGRGFISYVDPATNETRQAGDSRYASMQATLSGGQLNPPGVSGGAASYNPQEMSVLDGSSLASQRTEPLVFVSNSTGASDFIRGQGIGGIRGVFGDTLLTVAVFDKMRPTTGYHLAILYPKFGGEAQSLPQYTEITEADTTPVIIEIVATAPRPDWPVERRPVSPFHVLVVPWWDEQRSPLTLIFRINGEIVATKRAPVSSNEVGIAVADVSYRPYQEKVLR